MMGRALWWALLVKIAQYVCGYVVPAYSSFRAIESKGNLDDTQWLTYWLLFAVFTTLEGILWPVLQYVPLYQEMKLALLAWLSLPQFSGATLAYYKARPYVLKFMAFIENKDPNAPVDKKGQDVARLQTLIADVKAELSSSLATDLESVKADKMDSAAVGKRVEQLQNALRSSTAPKKADEKRVEHLQSLVSEVKGKLTSELMTDMESVKTSKMDSAALEKKIEQLQQLVGENKTATHVSPVMPVELSMAETGSREHPVDVAVVATAK